MAVETMLENVGPSTWVFLSILARLTPILVVAPPTYSLAIPRRLRAAFACVLAFLLTPVASTSAAELPRTTVDAIVGWSGELLLGILLGTIMLLSITAFQVCGRIVGQMAGFDMATTKGDYSGGSQSGGESTVLIQLFGVVAVTTLLVSGGYRYFLQCCLDSFTSYPVGSVVFQSAWISELEFLLTHTLSIGFRIAAPYAISMLLVNLGCGLIARGLPSMNILAIGLNINALAVLTLLLICVGTSAWMYQAEFAGWLESCQRVIAADH